jgi:anti-sigma factor RsiW
VGIANEEGRTHPESGQTPADITCAQVTSLIVDYVTGALDAITTGTFERHLQGCRDCIAFLNTYRKTIQSVRSLADDDVPSEMAERVRQFITQQMRSNRPNR